MFRRSCPGSFIPASTVSGSVCEHLQENFREFKSRVIDTNFPTPGFPPNTMGCSFGDTVSGIRAAPVKSFMGPVFTDGTFQDTYFFKSVDCEVHFDVDTSNASSVWVLR